eukprot:Phypoly_transcript_02899.p1 GENE.Phypoly_transcript_02899~~Phypoly_transcript_02899.p1  ORF type:complete len:505 (+),score=57.36 Phypoly_transcript_02899:1108-2622(+)
MTTNPNAMFYKTAPYLYAKHFNLTSVLDGLTGYKIVSGETGAIQEDLADGGVFGEIKPRDKPKMSENKYFTRQIIKRPARYNPYSRTTETTKAYRPLHYTADRDSTTTSGTTGEEGNEGVDASSSSGDFFGLTPSQKSVQHSGAFPGYQPYSEDSDITPTTLHNHNIQIEHDDDLPPPSLDDLPGFHSSLLSGYDGDDGDVNPNLDGLAEEGDGDFYKQLENLAQSGGKTASYNTTANIAHKNNTGGQLGRGKKPDAGQERLHLPETEQERWNYSSHKYQARASSLGTYKCWKCKRVGHLPEDCTAFLGVAAPNPSNPMQFGSNQSNNSFSAGSGSSGGIYSNELKRLHQRCAEISARKGDKCGECGARANLAQCLDCGVVVCDNKDHLIRHLQNNPSHNMLYSYKLRRQIKCSKTTCNVTNVYELHACAQCLEKCFDRHYSMMNAAWSGKGIKYIPNAICCDDHFEWHRINCTNARPGYSGMVVDRDLLDDPSLGGQLSEFLF